MDEYRRGSLLVGGPSRSSPRGQVIQAICEDFEITKKHARGRTKAAGVTKNVTVVQIFTALCETFRDAKFSVMIDESTDVSTHRHLCIVTRLYGDSEVKNAFFCLLGTEDSTPQ